MSAFYQTDGGGWSYDIPTRCEDDHEVDGLDRSERKRKRQRKETRA